MTEKKSLDLNEIGSRTLLENLPEGVFTINRKWQISSFNRTAEEITGFKRSEVIGRYCSEVFHSDLCKHACPLRTALKTGVVSMDQDVRIIDKGGDSLLLLVNAGILHDEKGAIIGAVETFRALVGETEKHSTGLDYYTFSNIVGKTSSMQRLFSKLPDVAASEANVLICGESGTGKDLFARSIHNNSTRSRHPFVAVSCAALAESLLESEMFGHEKAAFTGAVERKIGRFEMAEKGTIFLDEIGELKPEIQIKLLRVLEQREFERVGGIRTIPMRARIIAATNRDLGESMKNGVFREDLFYRLRTVPLTIPPLRQRRDDIPLLVEFFIKRLNERYKKHVRSVDNEVMNFFKAYHWPGNVRELERTLEYAYVFIKGPVLLSRYLPPHDEFNLRSNPVSGPKRKKRSEMSFESISHALALTGGNRKETAILLGLSRTSLWRRMKELDLS